jgi:hypothetical protein
MTLKDPVFPTNSDDLLEHLKSAYKDRFLVVLIPESCEDSLLQASVGLFGDRIKPVFPCLHPEISWWCEENNIECPFVKLNRTAVRYYLLFDPGKDKEAIYFMLRWFN